MRNFLTKRIFRFYFVLLSFISLVACGDLDDVAIKNIAPTANNVIITDINGGSVLVGDSLVGSYDYADAEGDIEVVSTFRWLRDGVAISGATSSAYILVAADNGASITFEVTPIAATGTIFGVAVSSSGITLNNSAPTASSVSISDDNGGSVLVGDSLTGNYSYADVDADLEGVSSYRWLRNGAPITGATVATYTLVLVDSGQNISFEVTPVAATGTQTGVAVTSSGLLVANSAPTASGVSITDVNGGSVLVGDSLTGNYSYADVDDDPQGTSILRWLRDGVPIGGASNITYILVAADNGGSITFEVTPIATTGTVFGIAVASTGVTVNNSAPSATGVGISDANGGSILVGDNLAGSYTYADVDSDVESSSTFRWLRNGAAISGATAANYTLVSADSGQTISFEITPVAATGTITGVAVASPGLLVINSVPTASGVSITDDNAGSIVVGDSLTGNYSYTDADGDLEGFSSFRWLRDGVVISGAISSTYVLVAADSTTSITFEVTPVAATGTATGLAVTSTGLLVVNSAPTASGVSITDDNAGSVLVGDNLTGNYTYADVDGDPEGVSTYRWLRNGAAITAATATSYILVSADSGQSIGFEVTPVAASGIVTGSVTTSAGIAVVNSAPTASNVTITDVNGGSALVGDSLTGSYDYADVDGDAELVSTFRWLRDGVVISGATSSAYVLVAADSAVSITFEVTPVAATGVIFGVAVSSSGISINNSAPTASGVSITDDNGNTTVVGDNLTGSYSYADVDGDLEGSSTFRWLRDGVVISGATSSTYILIAADSGTSITFEVTPVATSGTIAGAAVTSSGLFVANSAPTASSVSITDDNGSSALVGDSLTGNYTYADVDNDVEGSSTFRWLRNGAAISGATAANYTLVIADSGQSIGFEVTPVAATGIVTGATVTSAGITVANSAPTASSVSIVDDNGGSALVGDSLTGVYSYADVDGDLEGVSTFRWLRGGVVISGASSSTYILIAADSGTSITFEVTAVATTGTVTGLPVASGGLLVANSAPTASGVSITDGNGGSTLVGDSLTGNYTYADVDNDVEGSSTFRWLRNGAAIGGEIAANYVLVSADSGQSISFEVTPVSVTGTVTGLVVVSSGLLVANSAPTVNGVSITDDNAGSILVGDSLTGVYSYADVDGDLEDISTFRWLRNGAAIGGETAASYVLVSADSGQSISFEVTPVAATGTVTGLPVASGGLLVANSAPTVNAVSITDDNTGSTLVGDSLTGNYTYADVDGDLEGISTFRWLRNGALITGATTTNYTLVVADSGQSISFEVTPLAATGIVTGSAVTSADIIVANSTPIASNVIITDINGGSALVGDSLTGSYLYADVDGDLEGVSTFRWLRNGAAISGEIAVTYTLVLADSGQNISFEVTPVATSGTITGAAVTSAGIVVANSAPTASNVTVTDINGGSVLVGDSLTGSYDYADVDGDVEGVSTFQWLRNSIAISGATAANYTLVVADSGQSISFEVTPVASAGTTTGAAVTSAGVAVTNSAPTANSVSIADDNGGSVLVGDSLTGSYAYADVDADLEGVSTFRWLRNGTPITGETAVTYTLVATDSGQTITFEVTPIAATGTTVGTAIVSTGIVVANSVPTASSVSIVDDNGGSALVGDSLTGSYTYNDVDSDLEGFSTFRWLRDGVPISGALSSTYLLVAADSTASITFEVTPVAATGTITGAVVTSASVAVANSVPTASSVSITDDNAGSVIVGDSLTGNYTYADVDGDAEGISTFRWLRNGTPIVGEITVTYTLVAADSGQSITFEATPVASAGTATGIAVVSSGLLVANSAPTASGVNITDDNGGSVLVGDSLTGNYSYADVDGDLEGASTFRWLRNGAPIGGETAVTYTLVVADSGQTITFEVTPIALTGTVAGLAITSTGIAVANSAPTASSVSITDDNTGSVIVGDSLTGNYTYTDVDNDVEGFSTFRWLRNGTPITGETAITYTLAVADSGQSITFEVTPVAATGTTAGAVVTSVGVVVVNSAPTASGVSITDDNAGSVVVGDSLTGNYGYADVDGDLEDISTFRWLRNGTPITGETAITYTLIVVDSGQTVTFEVTPVAATGTTTGTAVTSVGVVVVNSAPTASSVIITDDNGASAVVGDGLTGSYSYADIDGDLEGISAFRWLRNGAPITGATASTYNLIAADVPTQITFEVIPIAATGDVNGIATISTALATGTAPVVSGFSRYLDINNNAINDANDQLIVPFDQSVNLNVVVSSDFDLPVTGDTFGTGATVAAGPASNEVTITLGTSPNFKTRQDFSNAVTAANSASGIDVAVLMMLEAIEGLSGIDAAPSIPIDLIPAYVDSLQSLGTNSSQSVALGDVDGDGDLDKVVANIGQANRIYSNDGSGAFTDTGQLLSTNNSLFVVLADVDGDSDLDMVVVNDGQGNRIYNNDGSGTFTDSAQSLGTNSSQSVALGDVDGDSDLDMVVANFGQGNRVYTNDSAGTFTDTAQSLGLNDSNAIVLGDVDGDGDLDMVVTNGGVQGNRVYSNDGSGTFTDSTQSLGSNNSLSVALGDVDGDGDLDMVVANDGQGNRIYSNDGNGTFTDSGQSLGTNSSISVALSDMDDDGDLDMVVANLVQGNVIYSNDGSGIFTDTGQSLGTNSSQSVALGDIDADGDMDMVVVNSGVEGNRIYFSSLSATWGSASYSDSGQALASNESFSINLGDVDNDGDLDMVVANVAQGNRIYNNDGSGTFTDSAQSLGSNNSLSIALGDIDGDGDMDMVVANDGQGNRIYNNDSSGIFTDSAQSLGATNNSNAIALGDVDGDGDLDMVVANLAQGNRVYTNDSAGAFTDSAQSLGVNSSSAIVLGDVDGDGDLDMVVGNGAGQGNRIYNNDGSGIFTDSTQSLGSNNSLSVVLGDVDGDGDLDMVVANDGQGNRIYSNNGSGTFTDSGQSLGTNASNSVVLRDIDGDGDLDMVVANQLQGNVIYNNNGSGIFTDSGQSLGTNSSQSVAIGDVDGDGDLDMVISNSGVEANRVYLNQ